MSILASVCTMAVYRRRNLSISQSRRLGSNRTVGAGAGMIGGVVRPQKSIILEQFGWGAQGATVPWELFVGSRNAVWLVPLVPLLVRFFGLICRLVLWSS